MPKKTAKKASARKKEPDVMVAQVHDGNGPVDVLLNVVGGKVASVTYPLDQGDRVTIPAALLRSSVEMINETDGDNG